MFLRYEMHAKAVNVGIYEWHVICMDMLLIVKINFALPIKSEKQKLAEAWYRDRLKIFQNLFESLGFIHIISCF